MIYTLTFNPALDYILKISDYREGMVNRPESEDYLPGGKGINVSVVLSNLGVGNTALGYIAGFTGNEIDRRLKSQGVNTDFITLQSGASRINVKLKTARETEINAKGPLIDAKALELLFEKLKCLNDDDFLVLAGSIPHGVPDTIYSDIIKALSQKRLHIVADAEKELLEKVLCYKPFLIKPNHHELGEMFGRELRTKEEIANHAVMLRERGARNVLVSMAGDGGILADESGKVMFCPAPKGTVVNSTGAGDSTVAGFLSGYISTQNYEKAFRTGLCAGSASTFSENLATAAQVEALYEKLKSESIQYL